MEKDDLAVATFDQCIKENPSDVEAYFNRGMAHYNRGQYTLAIENFDSALEIDPDNQASPYRSKHASII